MARLALVSCTIEKLRPDSAFRALPSSLASKSREVEGDEGNKKRSTSTSTRRASRRRRRRGTSPSTQRSGDEEEEPEAVLIEQTGEVEDNEAALSPTSRSWNCWAGLERSNQRTSFCSGWANVLATLVQSMRDGRIERVKVALESRPFKDSGVAQMMTHEPRVCELLSIK